MAAKKKRRKPRRVESQPWAFVLFTDLHVRADTLDRALTLLEAVRGELTDRGLSTAVCLGDFWDQRGVLSVRQLDLLCDEFDVWGEEGKRLIIVPGNHDQVSVDGTIHGVRPFDAYEHITVATDLILDPALDAAFVPWRELPEEQEAIFNRVPDGYTVFAHCEIKGATTNNFHKADGKVMPKDFRRFRAVYAGHYHKRQKLGTNAWYVGSPFEMNFGEREWPHGIAVVSSEDVEPEFIDFEGFPHHWRFKYPDDLRDFHKPVDIDVVEVHAPGHLLGTAKFLKDLSRIKAEDTRPIPLPEEEGEEGPPAAALKITDAIPEYVKQCAVEPEWDEEGRDRLRRLGQQILGEVPDTATVVPLGSKVEPTYVEICGFCGIKDRLQESLKGLGAVLIKGPMGVGKTSLIDAITWGLYGVTSPRKAGSSGSQLRADDVIHDEASEATVSVGVAVDDRWFFKITRTKKRGSGAKVSIEGEDENGDEVVFSTGISDSQDQINHVMGMPYDLWRVCVSLGQGAVANFVTDADKKRKEPLSIAFQLGACSHALKAVRREAKKLAETKQAALMEVRGQQARLETLQEADFTKEAERWEAEQKAQIDLAEKSIDDLKTRVEGFDAHLSTEPEWVEAKENCEKYIQDQYDKLTKTASPERAGKIHQEMGRVNSERGAVELELNRARERYRRIQDTSRSGVAICDACGQGLDPATQDSILSDLETQIETLQGRISSYDVEISNLQTQLGELMSKGSAAKSGFEAQINDARERLKKCNEGLNAMARIRANREAAVTEWNRLLEDIKKRRDALEHGNPFRAKMKERDEQIASLTKLLATKQQELSDVEAKLKGLEFWEQGFGPKGLPVLVLRLALHELESHANRFLSKLMGGRVFVNLVMDGDNLQLVYKEMDPMKGSKERSYLQLSGGMRRCAELAFVPFALSELIFSRTGVRNTLLVVDELTTHLDPATKPLVCRVLQELGRSTVLVVDHDQGVQGEFDRVLLMNKDRDGSVRLEVE